MARGMAAVVVVLGFALLQLAAAQDCATAKSGILLQRAWAHHDNERAVKLFDALAQGFCGIYADFSVRRDGRLLIPQGANLEQALKNNLTVQEYYFDPLAKLATQNNGSVYASARLLGTCETITFYADVMNNTAFPAEALSANQTFDALHAVLAQYQAKYPGMFTSWANGSRTDGVITVIVSGIRPEPAYLQGLNGTRLAALNGRLAWLDTYPNVSPEIVPIVSSAVAVSATSIAGANSTLLKLTSAQVANVTAVVDKAHAQGRAVRLTQAFPDEDTAAAWQALLNLGTDVIDTEQYGELRTFLLSGAARAGLPSGPASVAASTAGRRHRFL